MAIGKNKLGDQIIPKSEQQKHQHSKKADKDRQSQQKTEKPTREEEKQAVGYQDPGTTRAQDTPD
jgi:hypothetical protein